MRFAYLKLSMDDFMKLLKLCIDVLRYYNKYKSSPPQVVRPAPSRFASTWQAPSNSLSQRWRATLWLQPHKTHVLSCSISNCPAHPCIYSRKAPHLPSPAPTGSAHADAWPSERVSVPTVRSSTARPARGPPRAVSVGTHGRALWGSPLSECVHRSAPASPAARPSRKVLAWFVLLLFAVFPCLSIPRRPSSLTTFKPTSTRKSIGTVSRSVPGGGERRPWGPRPVGEHRDEATGAAALGESRAWRQALGVHSLPGLVASAPSPAHPLGKQKRPAILPEMVGDRFAPPHLFLLSSSRT